MSPPLPSAAPAPRAIESESIYGWLMSSRQGLANDGALAQMLVSQLLGQGSLPTGLGLSSDAYAALKVRHFSGVVLPLIHRQPPVWDARLLEEKGELIALLNEHRAGEDLSETWMSVIIATGCMANDHLWQDLGLWSRRDLSELMARNFPTLAAKNHRDMKWKKFLYKQLCEREGVYLCRAPSCAVCCDYAKCFESED